MKEEVPPHGTEFCPTQITKNAVEAGFMVKVQVKPEGAADEAFTVVLARVPWMLPSVEPSNV